MYGGGYQQTTEARYETGAGSYQTTDTAQLRPNSQGGYDQRLVGHQERVGEAAGYYGESR
jgi:hypothetical protein